MSKLTVLKMVFRGPFIANDWIRCVSPPCVCVQVWAHGLNLFSLKLDSGLFKCIVNAVTLVQRF